MITLKEYIQKLKDEHNIEWEVEDIENYVENKAQELLDGKNGGIDDETVKSWILAYSPTQEEIEAKNKQIALAEERAKKKAEEEEKKKAEEEAKQKQLREEMLKEEVKRSGMEPLF